MIKISSHMTYFNKRIFPLFWFGLLGLFFTDGAYKSIATDKEPPLAILIFPFVMAAFGYPIFKKLILDLVDEVFDCGDFLLVKNHKKEEKIQFSNIKNISYAPMMNPPRVTLILREPSIFGKEISFFAPIQFGINFFKKSPLIENLIDRVDQARRA